MTTYTPEQVLTAAEAAKTRAEQQYAKLSEMLTTRAAKYGWKDTMDWKHQTIVRRETEREFFGLLPDDDNDLGPGWRLAQWENRAQALLLQYVHEGTSGGIHGLSGSLAARELTDFMGQWFER